MEVLRVAMTQLTTFLTGYAQHIVKSTFILFGQLLGILAFTTYCRAR